MADQFHQWFCWVLDNEPARHGLTILSRWGHLAGVGLWLGLALRLSFAVEKDFKSLDSRLVPAYRIASGMALLFGLNLLHIRYGFPFDYYNTGIMGKWTGTTALVGSALLFAAAFPVGTRLAKKRSFKKGLLANRYLLAVAGPVAFGMSAGSHGGLGLGWGWGEVFLGLAAAAGIWWLLLESLRGRRFGKPLWLGLASLGLALLLFAWVQNRQAGPWVVEGEEPMERLGSWATAAGDVNGDGFDDFAIWSMGWNDYAGKVLVFYGSAKGPSSSPDWTAEGEAPKHQFGKGMSALGDVDGDGFGDFLVGAPNYGTSESKTEGKVYLYRGSATGLSLTPAWTRVGGDLGEAASKELLGDSLAGAGDINGDGLMDVFLGAYGYDEFRGRAEIFLGRPGGDLGEQPVWRGEGEAEGDWYGYSVASAGDVNGDGFADVITGAKQAAKDKLKNVGRVYVYTGSAQGLNKDATWRAQGEGQMDRFGWWVNTAACYVPDVGVDKRGCRCLRTGTGGDLNGDGYADVVVASYLHVASDGRANGKVYAYHGSAKGPSAKENWSYVGEQPGGNFGYSVAMGSFNGDSYADIVVGGSIGLASLFVGSREGLGAQPLWSEAVAAQSLQLANAGDVNGDGYEDVVFGIPYENPEGPKKGKAKLYYGGEQGLSPTAPQAD